MNLTDKILNLVSLQRKSAVPTPDLGPQGYSDSTYRFNSWRWGRGKVDHRAEVGDLDGNSLAMAVVNYTATRIPEAKPTVVTTKGDEVKSDPFHPIAQLIRRPNNHHVWANYALACSMSWWFSGNAYFYKARDISGTVKALWYLPHFLITPRWPNDRKNPQVPDEQGLDPFLSHYEYRVPGKEPVLYPAKDIIHLKRGVDLSNPRLGLGAFECLFKELYGDEKMALFTAAIMANMGLQVPVFTPKEKDINITEPHAQSMKEGWISKTTGENSGEPVIFTEPMDMKMFGLSPNDLDLSNLRMIPESRVAAVTGIPAATLQFMVGLQNGTSYASSEQSRQQGYEEVVEPIQKVWAEEFTWQLLREFKGSENSEFMFDTSGVRVLQEDKDALYKREAEALRAGGQTVNQFLQSVGKKPIGPQGEVYYVPGTSRPMTAERILATADGSLAPEPVDPSAQLAQTAEEVEKVLSYLERQAKSFYADAQ